MLRLGLKCYSKEMTFRKLRLSSLRFFLHGQAQHVFALYELLLNNALGVALAGSPTDREPVWLDRQCMPARGVRTRRGYVPVRGALVPRLPPAHGVFCFPQKFLFLDITGLGPTALAKAGNQLEIYIYLNRSSIDLEQNVTAGTLKLGCSPVVNLYQQRCEPVALTHRSSEYRVVPDARRPLAHEIYAVDRVVATSPNNEQFEYRPFYSFKHGGDRRQAKRSGTPAGSGPRAKPGIPTREPRSTFRWSIWIFRPRPRWAGRWTWRRPVSIATCRTG